MTLTERIDRWRHSHGFGVHSPAGFMLVKDVVRPRRRYRYYGEDRLENARIPKELRHLVRLSIRLYGRLRAREMFLNADPSVGRLLHKEGIRISMLQPQKSAGKEIFARIPFRGSSGTEGEVLLFDTPAESVRGSLSEAYPDAIILDSPRFLIVYKAPGLTAQVITLP